MPTSRLRTPAKPIAPIRKWAYGGPIDLAQLRGAPFLVHFWSIDCHLCHDQLPEVARWESAYEGRLKIISVHVPMEEELPDDELVLGMFEGHELSHPLAIDDTAHVAAHYGVRGLPAYFLYDAQGLLRHYHSGPNADEAVGRAIERVLSETEGASHAPH